MKHFLLGISLLVCGIHAAHAQVLINEVCNTADTNFLDEDGDAEDWIEFYNTGSTAVNMQGYTISRIENNKEVSWTFPSIIIRPFDYLTIFCSQKNRNAYFDHWEVPVYANNPWKYFIGYSNPPSNWADLTFNDASWSTGIGGIGYGDGDDSTVITPAISLFMRKSFFVADTSKIPTAALLIDYDDGFVAYLNGIEIARSNIGVYGDHPTYNTYAYDEHEATMYQNGNFSGAYFIDPHVIDSALKPGNNVFSIQTHNFSSGLDDLSSIPYFLIGVNDTAVTYYPFPATVFLHTNFNLNYTGQTIVLKNPSGTIVDQTQIGLTQHNHSRGRTPNGGPNWCLFDTPTPDTTNTTSACYTSYASTPGFSLPAGFYNGTQQVSFTGFGNDIVHYTLDGSEPTFLSPVFSGSVTVDSTRVIRARSFSTNSNFLPGPVITNTYFINENISLPVISLSSDPRNLFDWNYGIYVLGPNADTTAIPFFGANFWNGWARPGHVEYFDANGNQGFETNSELKIQGNYSKAWPQRGFSVGAKDNFEASAINYKLFPDKPITTFKSFNIRNAGSDWNTCHMRDRLNNKTVQKMCNIDIMDGKPCVLFINGKYWGVYEIREKEDKNYIANNHNVDPDKLDFLEFDGNIIEGSNKGFFDMVNFIGSANMSLQTNYDSARKLLDIANFADYFIAETYIINIDWLGTYTNNIKFWRTNKPVSKWRYVFWDTDLSMSFLPWYDGADTTNMLNRAINPPTANPHSIMLKSMLNNTEFRNYFVDRYCDMMNTIYRPHKFRKKAEDMHDEMLPEMGRHFNLWGGTSPWPNFIGRSDNVPEWENHIDSMVQFMYSRPNIARAQIQSQFGLIKPVDIGLAVDPPGAGQIQISTIIPDSLPWSGIYFDGVPVTMTQLTNPGYKFLYWRAANNTFSGDNLNSAITYDLDTNEVFTAYYRALDYYFDVSPNPFNGSTTITFELPEDMQASIKLYDLLGQKVADVVSDLSVTKAGVHSITLDAEALSLASGFYMAQFKAGDFKKTIKIIQSRN